MSVSRDAGRGRVKAVKRNLFGTVDHKQIRDDLARELKYMSEEKKCEWNFDFENCKPLPGRFRWQRVGKRLQTRKSPTAEISACDTESSENICRQNIVDPIHSTARYNLRTRNVNREVENIQESGSLPIKPPRKRVREFGDTPAGNGNKKVAGNCVKQRHTSERRGKTSVVKANERQRNYEAKRARR